jgi:hypothetical protein
MSKIYMLPIAAALLIAPATLARVQASPLIPHGWKLQSLSPLQSPCAAAVAAVAAASAVAAVTAAAQPSIAAVAARSCAAALLAWAWLAPGDVGMAADGGRMGSAVAGCRARAATSGCAAEDQSRMGAGFSRPPRAPGRSGLMAMPGLSAAA